MEVDAKSQCRDRSRQSPSSLTSYSPVKHLRLSRIVQGVRRVCVVIVVMEGPLRIESPYLRSLIVCTVPYTLQHIYPKEDEAADDPRQAASQARR